LFEITETIDEADRQFVLDKLRELATAANAPVDPCTIGIFKRDDKGQIIASLIAERFWQWMLIDMVWVEETHRKSGLGRALMQEAEDKARAWGCNGIYLWTNSWQAPDFYPKLGYTQFADMPNFPAGHHRLGFMKRLDKSSS
jgi:GNAT superfamily N-acetyltransferase